MKKLFLLLIVFLSLSLTACKQNNIDDNVIVVGATPNPHAKILEAARPYIESKGYKLKVRVYSDYRLPNDALVEGELDANFFQHEPFLNKYNEKNHTNLIALYKVHYEPLGIYEGKSNSLKNIKNGAKIAIPKDPTNLSRALFLLESNQVIELDKTKGMDVSLNDITSNPYNVNIILFDAAAIPAQLKEVDFAVINGNYAEGAKISLDKLIVQEDKESVAAKLYANVIAVKEENKNSPAIKVLIEALSTSTVKDFILNNYHGTVLPL